MFKYTLLILSVFLLSLIPGRSYSWFSSSADSKNPGVIMDSSIPERSSRTYVLNYNTPGGGKEIAIFPDSGNNAAVFADRIDIDIPLSILSKEAIDPEEFLDRLLAANLRIQNILDEYLAFRRRTDLLLKDLRIPYLEKQDKVKPKFAIAGEVGEGKKLKKDIENIIRHDAAYKRAHDEQVAQSVAVIDQITQVGAGGKKGLQQENGAIGNQITDSARYQKLPVQNMGKYNDNELPWIFRFILGILKYAYSNKMELLLGSLVVLVSVLIVMLVVKR